MRISDWSSDVCSSDLQILHREADAAEARLIAEEGVGQHIAFEIVARVAVRPVEAARQVELRMHPSRQRALRISGGEVQPVGRGAIGRAACRDSRGQYW